jgi:hypothetical protein
MIWPVYWKLFWSPRWTRTHLRREGADKALCGERINEPIMRHDDAFEPRNCCKRCWKKLQPAERELFER